MILLSLAASDFQKSNGNGCYRNVSESLMCPTDDKFLVDSNTEAGKEVVPGQAAQVSFAPCWLISAGNAAMAPLHTVLEAEARRGPRRRRWAACHLRCRAGARGG